jgi:hypothetical protein
MKLKILLISLFLAPVMAMAQDIARQELTWQSTTAVNTDTHDRFDLNCKFISRPDGTVDWVQKNGAKVTPYTITGKQGSWQNISDAGEFTFSVLSGRLAGTLTFRRNTSGVEVEMTFVSAGKNVMPYKFVISNVQ